MTVLHKKPTILSLFINTKSFKTVEALVENLKKDKDKILSLETEMTLLNFFDWLQKNFEAISDKIDPLNCISDEFDLNLTELRQAFTKLAKLGAFNCDLSEIHMKKCSLTPFGKMLVQLALPSERAIFLLFASQFHDFSAHFAIMTAFMSHNDIWLVPKKNIPNYHKLLSTVIASRQNYVFKHASDFLAAVEIFVDFFLMHGGCFYDSWLKENGFNQAALENFYFASIELMKKLASFGFRGCKNAISSLEIKPKSTNVIAIDQYSTTICSLILGWALTKNTFYAQPQKTPQILQQKSEKIKIHVNLQVDSVFYKECETNIKLSIFQAGIILREAINSCTRLSDRFQDTEIQLSYKTEKLISGTIQFMPVNMSHAIQFFKQNQKSVEHQRKFDNYIFNCLISIRKIDFPEVVRWAFEHCTGHKTIIDHSPLHLPLYNIPFDQKMPKTLPTTNPKTCFTPLVDTRSIAVAAKHFSLEDDPDDFFCHLSYLAIDCAMLL